MRNYIAFPKLGLEFNINPVAFTLGGITVRWYGIIIALALIIGAFFCTRLAKKEGLDPDIITDIVLVGAPLGIVCARLYYVFFNWEQYKGDLLSIFAIWNGGIAIYGAIIGAVLGAYIYLKVKKLNVLKVFDICIFGLLIGQIIGRWGNFVNAEAYGSITKLPWGMIINNPLSTEMVHPAFLYESLWNLLGFTGLLIYRKHKKFDGEIFLLYIAWYGIGRCWIEGLRTDSLMFLGTRVSQLVAVLTATVSVVWWMILRVGTRKQN